MRGGRGYSILVSLVHRQLRYSPPPRPSPSGMPVYFAEEDHKTLGIFEVPGSCFNVFGFRAWLAEETLRPFVAAGHNTRSSSRKERHC